MQILVTLGSWDYSVNPNVFLGCGHSQVFPVIILSQCCNQPAVSDVWVAHHWFVAKDSLVW